MTLYNFPLSVLLAGVRDYMPCVKNTVLPKKLFYKCGDLLEDDGVISITAWMDYPFSNPLKIAATMAESAEAAGLSSIHSHLVAVRSWGTITFLLKKSSITQADTSGYDNFAINFFLILQFFPVWLTKSALFTME